jgi:hypothetical protein
MAHVAAAHEELAEDMGRVLLAVGAAVLVIMVYSAATGDGPAGTAAPAAGTAGPGAPGGPPEAGGRGWPWLLLLLVPLLIWGAVVLARDGGRRERLAAWLTPAPALEDLSDEFYPEQPQPRGLVGRLRDHASNSAKKAKQFFKRREGKTGASSVFEI